MPKVDMEFMENTDDFCPQCGAQAVVCEIGDGDYYDGPKHLCSNCGAEFALKIYKVAYFDRPETEDAD